MLHGLIHGRVSWVCPLWAMLAGLPVAIVLLAQAASAATPSNTARPAYGPTAPAAAKPAAPSATTAESGCKPTNPDPKSNEIVICAEKPQGYRIDPDVLKARREAHNRTRPKRPNTMQDTSCTVVGTAPCIGVTPGINLIAAAATLAQMADRLSKGEEIGSMFVTDPTPSEYQLYLEAKREREAKEKQKAAQALAAKAKAAAKAAEQPKPK